MNTRAFLVLLALAIGLGSVWAVLAQREELARLRSGQELLTTPSRTSTQDLAEQPAESKTPSAALPDEADTRELMRLRSEVTRLSTLKRGLAGVAEENARLRGELERGQTNPASAAQLPPGYIRKAQAGMVGYGTPENTFQSFLWALRNHDLTNVLQALTPASAQKLQARFQDASQAAAFTRDMDALPGFGLQTRKDMPDGSIVFEVEVLPELPSETIRAQLINGEWKLDLPL